MYEVHSLDEQILSVKKKNTFPSLGVHVMQENSCPKAYKSFINKMIPMGTLTKSEDKAKQIIPTG